MSLSYKNMPVNLFSIVWMVVLGRYAAHSFSMTPNMMITSLRTGRIAGSSVGGSMSSIGPWQAVTVTRTTGRTPRGDDMFQRRGSFQLHATRQEEEEAKDNEIERLKSMAAKLRAEAAALEAQQAEAMAVAAERAFQKFDTDQDGKVTLEELKQGLEKQLKTELPERRVRQLMNDFDQSGDGVLQLDEFVTLDQFRNKLDALAREERSQAREKVKVAKMEEEAARLIQAQLELINDKPPSTTDKILSVLPYLFPLLDGFQYARFLVLDNPENPLAIALTIFYALYRAIPFGGFIAFFALYTLGGMPSLNRLIRYNMQQAIFLDIALFFPGLLSAIIQLTGIPIPLEVAVLTSDAIFVALLGAVGYATIASLITGQPPNKIPLISSAVDRRVPTVETIASQTEDWLRLNMQEKKKNEENQKSESNKEEEKETSDKKK